MTGVESEVLERVVALHARIIAQPEQPFAVELGELARQAESRGVLLFRLLVDHCPEMLPYYYFYEDAM